jgi:putative ABC transport system permease protein
MRALGATAGQIQTVFLTEAILLTMIGGIGGLLFGLFSTVVMRLVLPAFPAGAPVEYVISALAISVFAGVFSGVGPARRAAGLAPVDALRTE